MERDETETQRTIRFPKWLWDEIDRDAKRCRRSAVKQMEAILAVYYAQEDIEIEPGKLNRTESEPLRKTA